MIPEADEFRIARYFLHMYLPDEIMWQVEEKLLSSCICGEDEELDHDELVRRAVEIINERLEGKSFK